MTVDPFRNFPLGYLMFLRLYFHKMLTVFINKVSILVHEIRLTLGACFV